MVTAPAIVLASRGHRADEALNSNPSFVQCLRLIRKLKGITMQVRTTPRGLQRIAFVDQDDKPAILEQTSGIEYANPTFDEANSSFVLLGQEDAPVKLNMDSGRRARGILADLAGGRAIRGRRRISDTQSAGLLSSRRQLAKVT